MSVATAIRAIGLSATATAKAVSEAVDEIRDAQREAGATTTSSMNAAGPSTGGMGASNNAGNGNATMTTRGLATAVSILRRSL